MPATDATLTPRATSLFGAARAGRWSPAELQAWEALHAAEHAVRAAVDAAVEETHDITVSQLLLLGRLAAAEERTLRLTALADDAGLSLSRVSRLAVALEERGLLRRRTCPSDARAVNATLTDAGAALAAAAQATAEDAVRGVLFAGLADDEVEQLAGLLGRIAPAGAPICDGSRDEIRR